MARALPAERIETPKSGHGRTVDTYGRRLHMGDKAAVDRLDDSSGSKSNRRHGRRPRSV